MRSAAFPLSLLFLPWFCDKTIMSMLVKLQQDQEISGKYSVVMVKLQTFAADFIHLLEVYTVYQVFISENVHSVVFFFVLLFIHSCIPTFSPRSFPQLLVSLILL